MLLLSGVKDIFLKHDFKFCLKKNLQVINQCCVGQRNNLLFSQSPTYSFRHETEAQGSDSGPSFGVDP